MAQSFITLLLRRLLRGGLVFEPHEIPVADINDRQKLPNSFMPPGLMNQMTVKDFASLLDYLEKLAREQKK